MELRLTMEDWRIQLSEYHKLEAKQRREEERRKRQQLERENPEEYKNKWDVS